MKTTYISTYTLLNTPRSSTGKLQAELAKSNTEVVTGRYADVGLSLGYQTGKGVTLRSEFDRLDVMQTSNDFVAASLTLSQANLDSIRTAADEFMASLLAIPGENRDAETLWNDAQSGLATFLGLLNATDGTRYLFGGINSDVSPIADYATTPSAAIDAAFLAKFGFTQDDIQVATITGADMQDFIDNYLAPEFDEPAWSTNWSSASDTNAQSRISASVTVETSVNANADPLRKLAMAYTMIADAGTAGLNDNALDTLMENAIDIIGGALGELIDMQTALGAVQERVAGANEQMALQQTLISERLEALEGVDVAEAKTRIDALTTQLEMSYSLTAQLSSLSLINYV
jgi:flagellar hook-associated protein 3 FlgL